MRRRTHARACSGHDRVKGAALAGLALLLCARKRCGAKGTPKGAPETKAEPRPTKPNRSKPGRWLHFLTKPIRRRDQAKWKKEDEERAIEEAEDAKGVTPPPELSGKKAACGCVTTGCGTPAEKDNPEGGTKEGGGEGNLTSLVVKVLGAVATGVGVTGAVVVVGAAIFWTRFNAIGIPPIQAVTDIPRTELLVQGAQEMVIFVLIGLGAALLIALADPKGDITYGTVFVLVGLVLGAAAFAIFMTTLSSLLVLSLIGLALLLSFATIGVGFTTGQHLVPLLISVFIASFVFSAAAAVLIVKNQRFAQAIAIHFGPNKKGEYGKRKGITGIYVTATEKTIFYARADLKEAKDAGVYEVPRTDTTTYAVGPLELIEDDGLPRVEETAEALLNSLKADAQSFAPPEATTAGTSTKGKMSSKRRAR